MRIHVTVADSGAPWNLPLEHFAEQLTAHRPDALIALEAEAPGPRAEFELVLGEDKALGIYFTGEFQHLTCWDATIEDWAPIIEWFLSLLPLESDASIFLEAVPIPQELPRLAAAADIARILTDLDASV